MKVLLPVLALKEVQNFLGNVDYSITVRRLLPLQVHDDAEDLLDLRVGVVKLINVVDAGRETNL